MNKVILTGRVANIYSLKEYENGKLLKFDIAINSLNNKSTNPEFLQITVFNNTAINFIKYVQKGDLLEVIGRLKLNNFKNSQGEQMRQLEIYGDSIIYSVKSLKNKPIEIEKNNSSNEFMQNSTDSLSSKEFTVNINDMLDELGEEGIYE
ncbi:single-stranded DNA-binding protein [Metamycoplasma equirhinis]|uniref:single-stranded DNA-binding protein n=1 Tax=Metamycoplasma equirhinis TaxID=92402 RepID=UPI003593D178